MFWQVWMRERSMVSAKAPYGYVTKMALHSRSTMLGQRRGAPGYAMKQTLMPDTSSTYTVAKATMSCNFSPVGPSEPSHLDVAECLNGSWALRDGEELRGKIPGGVRCLHRLRVHVLLKVSIKDAPGISPATRRTVESVTSSFF
jgi:hypothetical protein